MLLREGAGGFACAPLQNTSPGGIVAPPWRQDHRTRFHAAGTVTDFATSSPGPRPFLQLFGQLLGLVDGGGKLLLGDFRPAVDRRLDAEGVNLADAQKAE